MTHPENHVNAAAMAEKIDLLALFNAGKFTASRSSAVEWLRANHDALVAGMKGRQVDWKAVAHSMEEGGYLDARGKPPLPGALQRAWNRIKLAAAAQALPPSPTLATPPAPLRQPGQAQPPLFSDPSPARVTTQPTVPPTREGTALDERRSFSARWNPVTTDADIERLIGKPKAK